MQNAMCLFKILVWRYRIRCRMRVNFLEQGLMVLQVSSTSMEKQDTHKNILIIQKVGHSFDVYYMGMLENSHKCQK